MFDYETMRLIWWALLGILLIGFAVCAWFFVHLFILPKDAEGYRSWVYIGLAVLPLAVIMMIVIW